MPVHCSATGSVVGRAPHLPLNRREFPVFVQSVMDSLGLDEAEVSINLTDDARMAELNRAYRGLPGPTNVLSFPADDPDRPVCLGDIVLSVDTLLREARLYGQDPQEHLVRLLAHALLHLSGWEHGEAMENLTEGAVLSLAR